MTRTEESGKVAAFDIYCKKCLKFKLIRYINQQNKLNKQEFLTDVIEVFERNGNEEIELSKKLKVMNFEIDIANELLYDALQNIKQRNVDILYLSACENMSDCEISRILKIPRRTVQYIRVTSQAKIRKMMGDKK